MKKKINVYTKLDNFEENNEFQAIIYNDVIKYIDLDNNKMIVDIKNDLLTRENSDYLFVFDFKNENIDITIKKLNKSMGKKIKTLLIDKKKKSYTVRYLLIDEKQVNEYYVNF